MAEIKLTQEEWYIKELIRIIYINIENSILLIIILYLFAIIEIIIVAI